MISVDGGTSRLSDLLNADTVVPYLVQRGVLTAGETGSATLLGGGVSNVVLAVAAGGRTVVVKQALPRLQVAEEWLAKRERSLTEAAGLEVAARLIPGFVPSVLDVDPRRFVIVVECAPAGWQVWKDKLLRGSVVDAVGERLGRSLGLLHAGTSHGDWSAFADQEAFEQLRVDPYYRTVMRRHPDLAASISTPLERMRRTHVCLVHGDCSPKNVLVGDEGLWLIDFEVAHLGDPVFDVAFLLNHLLLKSLHRPSSASDYARCAAAFCAGYAEGRGAEIDDAPYLSAHVGCLLLARVDGKSPAEYLTEPARIRARDLAASILRVPPATLADLLHVVETLEC